MASQVSLHWQHGGRGELLDPAALGGPALAAPLFASQQPCEGGRPQSRLWNTAGLDARCVCLGTVCDGRARELIQPFGVLVRSFILTTAL